MHLRFLVPRHRRDWLSYKRESRLAEGLGDPARVTQMEELYQLYLMFQRGKPPEQLEAEARAERRLNAWRLNPRYQSLLDEARGDQDSQTSRRSSLRMPGDLIWS